MTQKQVHAVVVGASSILGKELIEELNSSSASAWDIQLFDEQEGSESQISTAGDEAVLIQPLSREALEGADLVFFAGDPATAREYSREAVRRGAAVLDLTSALEGEAGFLLRSPWLPAGQRPDLETAGVIAVHPAALMLALVSDRLDRRLGLERLTATVMEPASQAGREGVDELHQQTVSLLSFQSVPRDVYDTQVAFNLQNALGEAAKTSLKSTRERIQRHLPALLGPELGAKVRFDVIQAPVFHGYAISAFVDLRRPATQTELMDAINGGVVLAEEDTAPSNTAVTDTGDLLVAVTPPPSSTPTPGFWLWMAADNLRFTARSAVAAALELLALRPVTRVQ